MRPFRSLRALLVDLERSVQPQNRAAVSDHLALLDRTVAGTFTDTDLRHLALVEDRQGIGGASETASRAGVTAEP